MRASQNQIVDPIALTKQLIEFDTINPPEMKRRVRYLFGKLLENSGFRVSYHQFSETRTVSSQELAAQTICRQFASTGHIDTVPLGAKPGPSTLLSAKSQRESYTVEGAQIQKWVAAFVSAVIQISAELENGHGAVLVITAGEETGCEGSYYLASLKDVLGKAGAMVVAEPTSNRPLIGHKGLSGFPHTPKE